MRNGKWFDGYDQHDCVVLDDFYGWMPYHVLLAVCDSLPFRAETKGGRVVVTASTIVITSNKLPVHFYNSDVDMTAFFARLYEWALIPIDLGPKLYSYPYFDMHYEYQTFIKS